MDRPDLANNQQRASKGSLPRFAWWRERLIAAEQIAGWLADCDDAGRFLAVSQELVDTLALALRQIAGDTPALEVCAGSGELARSLTASGLSVQATDAEPPNGSEVLRMSANMALEHFQPTVVLGTFVPFDAGVDEAVLACASVKHYVSLNARIGDSFGSPALWQTTAWRVEPLESVRCWMLTRHDVWLGTLAQPGCSDPQLLSGADYRVRFPQQPRTSYVQLQEPGGSCADLLRHGEAWHFRRVSDTSSPDI